MPSSYLSRRGTFKEKLSEALRGQFEFHVLVNGRLRRTVMIPAQFRDLPVAAIINQEDHFAGNIPPAEIANQDEFLTLVHLALQIRKDIQEQPIPDSLNITESGAIDCIPDSLYMFLNLVFGGQELLAEESESPDLQQRVLNIAQDVVYAVHGGKKLTPKHIGLASALHQATRSKALVNLFHKAGHVMSYTDVIRLDNSLAQETLKTADASGSVLPTNLVANRFVHFSADNIDINEFTLDGKGTFHATQVAAWQRGPPKEDILNGVKIRTSPSTLIIPEGINELTPPIAKGVMQRPYSGPLPAEVFHEADGECTRNAVAKDMCWLLTRSNFDLQPSWTKFNEKLCPEKQEVTTIGFLPIIKSPASDLDTLNTVVQRAMYVSKSLNQRFVVLTVDEAGKQLGKSLRSTTYCWRVWERKIWTMSLLREPSSSSANYMGQTELLAIKLESNYSAVVSLMKHFPLHLMLQGTVYSISDLTDYMYEGSHYFHVAHNHMIMRVHYQTCIWKQADQPRPVLPMMDGWDSSGDE